MEDITSNPQPHLIKEKPVDFTSRPELEEKEPQEALHVPLLQKGRVGAPRSDPPPPPP